MTDASSRRARRTVGARPRRRLGEDERREQIVRATVSAVAAHGYDNTSMARIAEHAEVSKGLISHYFADKDDLMARTVIDTVRVIRTEMADRLDLTRPLPDIVRAAIREAARLHTTHREQLTALNQITSNLRRPDGSRRLTLADYEETHLEQQALFARGQAAGTLRDIDVRLMAVIYQGAVDTMLSYAEAHPDTDLELYADTLADVLLDGFRLRGPA